MFSDLPSNKTGINFTNQLSFKEDFNIYTYRNFYNGGGVAIGDLNNDGLNDVYFTANMLPNQLYINKGNFKFENVTEAAGVAGEKGWSTGVSLVDINADGHLDIYVCNSGDVNGDDKQNELFINQGDGTFIEQANEFGLADEGFSTHAAFFDYDHDGDLDCYLLNNSYRSIGSFNLKESERDIRDENGGDKLFKNDNGTFVDASEEAGIFGSVIGFGLGVTVGDINMDGWEDIFISNDFFERDYLYINQQNGSFKEELPNWINSISAASMGADMADMNNDLWPDIFVTEMLPETNDRIKTKTTFESWDNYQFKLKNDYYHQFTRNMLQLNSKNEKMVEVGRYAGVHATDWSWAALSADFDLDGTKEIFVANGIYQDLTDQDFIMFASSNEAKNLVRRGHKEDFQKLIDIIPSEKISNYLFKQNNDLTYTNNAEQWGLNEPSHSNGSAYGDLDNDGDLDLVVNNVNMPAFIYRNNMQQLKPTNFVKIKLKGGTKNPLAYGAKVFVLGKQNLMYDNMPIRGFQSTMANEVIIPSKNIEEANNKIVIQWPNGQYSTHNVNEVNQTITIDYNTVSSFTSSIKAIEQTKKNSELQTVLDTKFELTSVAHKENNYSDFDYSRLVYEMKSRQGPKLAVGDVNQDGLDDFYLCGAKDQTGQLMIQQQNGTFSEQQNSVFEQTKTSEDVDALFVDIDNDNDLDLYVVSGGSEFAANSPELADRLYMNTNGKFELQNAQYPTDTKLEVGSCVTSGDFNDDGFIDLFVGTGIIPRLYGVAPSSYLLQNNGDGSFTQVENTLFEKMGMVSDATFADVTSNGKVELIVVGEYMPIEIFTFNGAEISKVQGEQNQLTGWWNAVETADVDGDGDLDILIGNQGQNSRFKAGKNNPIHLYTSDFDANGTFEQIMTTQENGKEFPMTLKHDLIQQLPYLKRDFLKYEDYKSATIQDIFNEQQLANAHTLQATELRSGVLINNKGSFSFQAFSPTLQMSCIHAFAPTGNNVFIGGNFDAIKPELGRQDASRGYMAKMNALSTVSFDESLSVDGVIEDIKILKTAKGKLVLFARNNDTIIGYEF